MEAEWGPGSQDSSSASNKLLQAQLSPGSLESSVHQGADRPKAMRTPQAQIHSEQSRYQGGSWKDRRSSVSPGCCAQFLGHVNLGERTEGPPLTDPWILDEGLFSSPWKRQGLWGWSQAQHLLPRWVPLTALTLLPRTSKKYTY